MPYPQHNESISLDFMAHLVVPHRDAANLARIERLKPPTHARLGEQATRRSNRRLHGTRRSGCIERGNEPVQPRQIRSGTPGSFQVHHCGAGSGASGIKACSSGLHG